MPKKKEVQTDTTKLQPEAGRADRDGTGCQEGEAGKEHDERVLDANPSEISEKSIMEVRTHRC